VSCVRRAGCRAVGGFTNSAGQSVTFAEARPRFTWSVQRTANPLIQEPSTLEAVSCTSASACSAVGDSTSNFSEGAFDYEGTRDVAFAERWDGTRWTVQATAGPVQAGFSSVSCTSENACIAVGTAFAERWDGTRWTMQRLPKPGRSDVSVNAVSCASASACTAVGHFRNSAGQQVLLAERWDGSNWTIQKPTNPAGTEVSLDGVSCISASACTAVGKFTYNEQQVPLAERWGGSSWTIQNVPNPNPEGLNMSLRDVSCTSETACTAVGYYEDSVSGNTVTLAERWDGSSWTITSTPNPGRMGAGFTAVSCNLVSVCTAGGVFDGSTPFAEQWDGTTWTIQSMPKPTGATDLRLNDASCPFATSCTVVGTVTNSSGVAQPLVERSS
jgi:hypothetical protein